MLNLCHFDVVVCGNRHAAHSQKPLVWSPIFVTGYRFPHITGYLPLELTGMGIPEGTHVIVPRFAAAVSWALAAGLVPFCVPLDSQRDPAGSSHCLSLVPAPAGLEMPFSMNLDISRGLGETIIRAIPGDKFNVEVEGGSDLPPVRLAELAIRLADNSVQLPASLARSFEGGILVPGDGLIVRAVAAAFPRAAILITGVITPGKRTPLYRVL